MESQELLRLIEQAADEQWDVLDLSYKEITNIPIEIAKLTNLKSLYLWNNQITKIPAAIANLTHLTSLNLSDNQIAAGISAI